MKGSDFILWKWLLVWCVFQTPWAIYGQIAVAVVSDTAETMTNVQRFKQYALQAEQYLREVEYWGENVLQGYRVIDRLGGANSFWVKMESLLDGVDIAQKVSGRLDWGDQWYPDDYVRMIRAGNRFGHAADKSLSGEASKEKGNVGRYLDSAHYFMQASVDYVNTMEEILHQMSLNQQNSGEVIARIADTPVSEEEGLAGIMEKDLALQLMGVSAQGTTNSLLRTLIQANLEEFSMEQMNRLAEWEYRHSQEQETMLREYQKMRTHLGHSVQNAEQRLHDEKLKLHNASSHDLKRERLRLGRW